jgi:predicted AAA+ superfamily ATPase
MHSEGYRLSFHEVRELLARRLGEPAPGRIQLLAGPRQVGKTTLLLEVAEQHGNAAIYAAADGPEAALPGFWERLWIRAEEAARTEGRAFVLLDEVHLLQDSAGSRESLAGRFERITLTHWSAGSLSEVFGVPAPQAAELLVRTGSYPGAFAFRNDLVRWSAYVRDAILEPAIGKDILALAAVRKPALLRQVFGICASSPAQIVSLQKIQGQLQDPGALATIGHYLGLLEEAFLVAPLGKHATRPARVRAAPPKLITLNNALLAVMDPRGIPDRGTDPSRFGAWVENACLAHAWNAGQRVTYWREEPLEVDAVIDGSWGSLVIEVKTGSLASGELRGIGEFVRRHPKYRPLVVCDDRARPIVERTGLESIEWRDFLLRGPPAASSS